MNKPYLYIYIFLLSILGCKKEVNSSSVTEKNIDNASYINPFICTSDDHGQTDVAAAVPFGMVKPCPDTNPISHSGYDYSAKEIVGFSNTRFSGVGCRGVGGNLRILPFAISKGDTIPQSVTYSKESEKAQAGYYSVDLNNGVKTQLTATRQVAFHQYTFPKSEKSGFTIDLESSYVGHISDNFNINNGVVSGEITSVNVCKKGAYTFYFAIAFNKETSEITKEGSKLIVKFSTAKNQDVLLRCALSVVDENSAINNLKNTKTLSFSQVKTQAFQSWNNFLSTIDVETENDTLKELFYTHLYHTSQSPFIINDENGMIRGSNGEKYKIDTPYYHGWSVWDTFRTKLPLFSLLYPNQYKDMLWSLRVLYKQGKPDWATKTEPFLTIRTEHTIPVLLDAHQKGILPYSLADVYNEMKEEAKHLPFKSPDNVLESSYDLWALSKIAQILGKDEDAQFYKNKAFEYKTLWKDKFLVMDDNSDIMHGDGLYEGTLWQYRWFVPFDIQGIQTMMGGKDEFEKQLDYFFNNELFNIGNQPDIQVPYLYNYTNSPWKTQALIHKLLNEKTNNWYGTHEKFKTPIVKKIFTATPDGFIKEMDDDAGTMSSWFLWSSMGMYPIFPGSTEVALTAPQFNKITIKTNSKPLEITTSKKGLNNIYIQKVTWNNKIVNSSIIDFNTISKGGVLHFELGDKPNKQWGKQN
ncbi:GH92 family glycosyl hydrolase [Algibacter pacificus]|uniref:GH92 family glycosyl hydrolase n=1 Tax=Algibacter pacificus TaxID=2599389 RepID=UPI0011C93F28|nr:GH92 family glycosyl hydrolase [Algibacter pacificus]